MTKQEKLKQEKLNKLFPITSLTRADLIMEEYDEKEVLKIKDSIMEHIARKIGDGIMEEFWWILNDMLSDMGYKRKE